MKKNCTLETMYRAARCCAGHTQESAAELLGCSVRTIANYDSGIVPVDAAAMMARMYDCPLLIPWHVSRNTPCRSFLPDLTTLLSGFLAQKMTGGAATPDGQGLGG